MTTTYSKIEKEFIDTLLFFDFDVDYLYENYFNKLKEIKERDDYHPEPSVYHHLLKVFNRANNLSNRSTILTIAAIFHDIGKLETYSKNNNSFGHEYNSAKLFLELSCTSSLSSINIKNIVWLIENHMRMHQYDNMKKSKQDKLNSHECFYYLKLLAKMDDMNNEEFNDKNIQ